MKISVESKTVPTFLQWVKSSGQYRQEVFPVERVLISEEWRSFTFICSEFKLNYKLPDKAEFTKFDKQLTKIISKPCMIMLESKSEKLCDVLIEPCSDAVENPMLFKADNWGWIRE